MTIMTHRIFFIVLIFGVFALGSEDDLREIDSIVQEPQCREAGGSCTISEDCPDDALSETLGLCPQQQSQGVECCYGVSVKETRCNKRGGSCMAPDDFCNPDLIFPGARDCPEDYKCCIMTFI